MLRDTLFPVKEVPAIGKFPKNMNYTDEETKTTGWKFILREDTGQILSCMTNEYKMVTNKQIIDIAKPVLKKHKAELVEAVSLGDGQKTGQNLIFRIFSFFILFNCSKCLNTKKVK